MQGMLLLHMTNIHITKGFSTCLAAVLPVLIASTADASTEPLLDQLRSDHAAMVSAEQDFHSRRDRGTLNGNEAADYASYVAGLHRRVAEDCVALAEQAIVIPAALDCPDDPPAVLAPAAIDQAAEQTGAEVTQALDAELFTGLGEFDEMLLREQERVKAATPRSDAGGGGAGGGAGSSAPDSGTAEQTGLGTTAGATYGEGAGPGSSRSQGRSSAPPGTPDGSDDDVVARQLREAAEKETDPELKKKLWEEYRKYKEGTF
jgi:hypothetical protein